MENNQFGKKDESIKHKLGDAIERVGEKLSDMGASKLGKSVYSAGNKLEHSEDSPSKAPSAPVDSEPRKY